MATLQKILETNVVDKTTAKQVEKLDATLALIDDLNEGKVEKVEKKQQPINNGFIMQAGVAQVGEDPFWVEVHLVEKDKFFISGNKNGIMSRAEIKALRKQLKYVMNLERDLYGQEEEDETPAPFELVPFEEELDAIPLDNTTLKTSITIPVLSFPEDVYDQEETLPYDDEVKQDFLNAYVNVGNTADEVGAATPA